jgi:hypothetical protein
MPRDTAQAQRHPDANALPKRARTRQGKVRLLQRSQLDGRTAAARSFDQLVAAIEADLGGSAELTAIEKALIEGFCGATITLQGIDAKMCLGEDIVVAELAQSVMAMVRVASRLGEARRAKDVSAPPPTSEPGRARSSALRSRLIEGEAGDG